MRGRGKLIIGLVVVLSLVTFGGWLYGGNWKYIVNRGLSVGDILYADRADRLTNLNAVAINETLKSAGVLTAPVYGDANVFAYSAKAMYPTTTATLSEVENRVMCWKFTATTATIAPAITTYNATAGRIFLIHNSTGGTLTFKASGQAGGTIASTKSAWARSNGTDYKVTTID